MNGAGTQPDPGLEETIEISVFASDYEEVTREFLGRSTPAIFPRFLDALPTGKAGLEGSALLVVLPSPEATLARQLAIESGVDQALTACREILAERLGYLRKLRRSQILIDGDALAEGDPALTAALGKRLGLSFAPPAARRTADPARELRRLAAQALIANDAELSDLAGELGAMRFGAGDESAQLMACVQAAVSGLASLEARPDQAAATAMGEEIALLRKSLAVALEAEQDERERSFALSNEVTELRSSINTLLGQGEAAEDVLSDAARRLRGLTQERDALRATLAGLLDEIDGYAGELGRLREEQKATGATLNEHNVLIADFAALRRRLADEAHVHGMRESVLGHHLLELGRRHEHDLAARDSALAEARARGDEFEGKNAELLQAAEHLEAEATRILGSKSWRITEPLRAMRRLVGRARPS